MCDLVMRVRLLACSWAAAAVKFVDDLHVPVAIVYFGFVVRWNIKLYGLRITRRKLVDHRRFAFITIIIRAEDMWL